MKICGIYKIENLINHKIYIGQAIDIHTRWSKHRNSNDDFVIHRAFRKYGIENFKFSIVEECRKELLNEKEQYYIQYYNSLVPNGYNMIEGGSNGAAKAKRKPVNQYTLTGEYIQTFESASEAERQTGINNSNIISCCKFKRDYAGEFQWRYADEQILKLQYFEKQCKIKKKSTIIQQIDIKTNNIVKEFSSLTEASNVTGISLGNIGSCCQGKRLTAGGYKWHRLIKEEKKYIIIKKYINN